MKNPGKITKGDTVKIITGKDRGKQGKVIQVFPALAKVVVDGVNMYTKHLRPRKEGEKGQRVEFSAPIHVSNVKLVGEKPKRVAPKKEAVKSEKGTAQPREAGQAGGKENA